MQLIATHDSATGERGAGFFSWLVTPFAKTQTKTIREQIDAGCTMFDIRVRYIDGEFYCAHGLWRSKRTAEDILADINNYTPFPLGEGRGEAVVALTYEGAYEHHYAFVDFVMHCKMRFLHITWLAASVKYGKESTGINVKYDHIIPADEASTGIRAEQAFLPLDGHSWHTYLPVPWLWDRLYTRPHTFNSNTYRFVDFL